MYNPRHDRNELEISHRLMRCLDYSIKVGATFTLLVHYIYEIQYYQELSLNIEKQDRDGISSSFQWENYDLWAVKMEAYLVVLDLWEAIEKDYEVLLLPDNPTMTQIKNHKEKKTRKVKAKSCLFAGVSTTMFTRIMTLKSAKAI
ncbi:hypothetical protein CR513_41345, partial [Mucuna pruriens]